jgi:2-polyprenyl-6-methoxyphenol hydroxylase-like FAD-dependent oxidoreductase
VLPAPGLGAIGQGPGLTLPAGAFTLTGAPPAAASVAEAYSPRHFVLDQILVDAAVAAGLERREGLSVQAVIGDGDRITSIRGRTKAGSTVAEKGRLVVGADGRHSLVARSVQASESNTKPPRQGT